MMNSHFKGVTQNLKYFGSGERQGIFPQGIADVTPQRGFAQSTNAAIDFRGTARLNAFNHTLQRNASMRWPSPTNLLCPILQRYRSTIGLYDGDYIDLCSPERELESSRISPQLRRTLTGHGELPATPHSGVTVSIMNAMRMSPPPSLRLPPLQNGDFIDLCSPEPANRVRPALSPIRTPRQVAAFSTGIRPPLVIAGRNSRVSRSSVSMRNNSWEGYLRCSVCFENFITRRPTATKCGHIFCASCIRHAIRMWAKCPICNCKVSAESLSRIYF